MILEVCVDNLQSAIDAEQGGANRIELCSSLELGGLTPSAGLLIAAKRVIKIPIFCMLRPRAGDFVYSSNDIETMLFDAKILLENGADGFVYGILNYDSSIDTTGCQSIMDVVTGYPCTFHRAFDFISDSLSVEEKFAVIHSLGFSRILTTGGGKDVSSSINNLVELKKKCNFDNIIVIPGGGVNKDVSCKLKELGFPEIHSSCSVYDNDKTYGGLFNHLPPMGKRKVVSYQKVCDIVSMIV